MLALILVCQTKCFDGGRLQPRLETVWWFMDESTLRAFDCTRQCTMFSSSLITQSHTTQHTTLDSVTQHQDRKFCFSVTTKQHYSQASFIFTPCNKTHYSKTVTVCFQKLLFLEKNRLGLSLFFLLFFFFLVFVCSTGNSGRVSLYSGIVRVERGPHLGCSAQSSQSLWVF